MRRSRTSIRNCTGVKKAVAAVGNAADGCVVKPLFREDTTGVKADNGLDLVADEAAEAETSDLSGGAI